MGGRRNDNNVGIAESVATHSILIPSVYRLCVNLIVQCTDADSNCTFAQPELKTEFRLTSNRMFYLYPYCLFTPGVTKWRTNFIWLVENRKADNK